MPVIPQQNAALAGLLNTLGNTQSARRDETARIPHQFREGSGGGAMSDLLEAISGGYDFTPMADAQDIYKAATDPTPMNVGVAALAALGPAGDLAKGAIRQLPVAIKTIQDKVPPSWLSGWYRNGDKGFKPKIAGLVESDKDVKEAALTVFHDQFNIGTGSKVSFDEFVDTPITLYRVGPIEEGTGFASFTYNKDTAQKMQDGIASLGHGKHKGAPITTIQVKPRDTFGMMSTTAEGEVLVPTSVAQKALASSFGRKLPAKARKFYRGIKPEDTRRIPNVTGAATEGSTWVAKKPESA